MRAWFDSLERRERIVLSVGAVVVSLIIAWGLIWTPLRNAATELGDAVSQKNQLLVTLQRAEALSTAGTPIVAGGAGQSLVLLVDQTHRAHGLTGTLSRNQPDGTDGIRVTFQAASFDSLVDWLVTLQNNHGVSVESANFDRTRQAGLVGATLVLRRS